VRPTRVLSGWRPSEGGWHKGDGAEKGGKGQDKGESEEDASVAPAVGKWAEASFPMGSQSNEEEPGSSLERRRSRLNRIMMPGQPSNGRRATGSRRNIWRAMCDAYRRHS
jgi:hypothetical protein